MAADVARAVPGIFGGPEKKIGAERVLNQRKDRS
jgi:hypothetical protein